MGSDGTGPAPRIDLAGSALLRRALELARLAHDGQERKGDGAPYVVHPVRVAELVEEQGLDERAVAAALLHDVVEGSELAVGDLEARFGEDVATLVAAMTEDEGLDRYEQRKDALRAQVARAGDRAIAIYVADKLANLRDMRRLYAEVGERAGERFTAPDLDTRVRAWRGDLEMAARVAPGLALIGLFEAELAGFEADRAARAEAQERTRAS